MSSLTNTINVDVDKKIEKESAEIFNELGIDMSTAINMFLIQVIRTKSIPFDLISPKPSRKLRKSLKEEEDLLLGKNKTK